jgi:RNA polymerase sigma-70 factor (ECF subfamily)
MCFFVIEREKLIHIVQGLQNGEPDAAAELFETFQRDIYYFILKTVNNDSDLAEDLTQDTFVTILEKIHDLQEPAAFVTWSKQIAYSKCTGYFRKHQELLADEDEDGYSVFDTIEEENEEFIPGAALDKEDLKQTILTMINELPECLRRVRDGAESKRHRLYCQGHRHLHRYGFGDPGYLQ